MAEKALTLKQARGDVGYLPALFATIFGAPAIVTLIQMAFETGDLATPVQVVIDAYQQGMAHFAALVEPPIRRLLDSFVRIDLELHPHWRHFLVLGAGLWLAQLRIMFSTFRMRDLTDAYLLQGTVFVIGRLVWGLGVIALGSVLTGLAPLDGGWWAQGLIAWLGVSTALAASDAHITVKTFYGNELGRVLHMHGEIVNFDDLFNKLVWIGYLAPVSTLPVFLLGAGLSFAPGVGERAALIVVLAVVSLLGLTILAAGLKGRDDFGDWTPIPNMIRFGLTILGGFIGACLMFALSWALSLS